MATFREKIKVVHVLKVDRQRVLAARRTIGIVSEVFAEFSHINLRVLITDIDVFLVVNTSKVSPSVPGIAVRPVIEEVRWEDVVFVVCLLIASRKVV